MAALPTRRRSRAAAALFAVAVTLGATGGVAAGRHDAVDPTFMTPALNPSFAWDCWRSGDKIVCEGEQAAEHHAVEAIPCPDGGWIYLTGTERQTLRRVSDAQRQHPLIIHAAFFTLAPFDRTSD